MPVPASAGPVNVMAVGNDDETRQAPCAGITQIRFNGYNLRPKGPPHDKSQCRQGGGFCQ